MKSVTVKIESMNGYKIPTVKELNDILNDGDTPMAYVANKVKPRKIGVCRCGKLNSPIFMGWAQVMDAKYCPYCGKRIGGAK